MGEFGYKSEPVGVFAGGKDWDHRCGTCQTMKEAMEAAAKWANSSSYVTVTEKRVRRTIEERVIRTLTVTERKDEVKP